jgi:hypothetical protein
MPQAASTSRRHCCDSTFRGLKPTLQRRRTPQSAGRHSSDTSRWPGRERPIEDVSLFERSPFGSPRVPRRQIVESNGLISFLRQDLAGVLDIARASRNRTFFVTALFIQLSLSKQCAPLFRSCRTGISQSAILSPLRPSSADQAAEKSGHG